MLEEIIDKEIFESDFVKVGLVWTKSPQGDSLHETAFNILDRTYITNVTYSGSRDYQKLFDERKGTLMQLYPTDIIAYNPT